MRTVLYILQKEFLQIFRNRAMLPIIVIMPVLQLVVLGFAATFEVRNVSVHLVDLDASTASYRLAQALEASGYFRIERRSASARLAEEDLLRRRAGMILEIPRGFERRLLTEGPSPVLISIDAEDGAAAGIALAYVTAITGSVGKELAAERGLVPPPGPDQPRVEVIGRYWFNADMSYPAYMVPGILVLLVTIIGGLLTAMNIVREKETGTIEQLNVAPIKKYQFIVGKLMPFWILGMGELAGGMVVARLIFAIPIQGSLALVFFSAGIYLVVVLGIGLLTSTLTETQQQAMFVMWFLFVLFILLGGLFTPLESMPIWAQRLSMLNPVAWFIMIMRSVLVRGAGPADIRVPLAALASLATVILTLAIVRHHKVHA